MPLGTNVISKLFGLLAKQMGRLLQLKLSNILTSTSTMSNYNYINLLITRDNIQVL